MRVLGARSTGLGWLRLLDFLMCVAKGEFDKAHIAKPFTRSFKFLFSLLIFTAHCGRNLTLKLSVDLGYKKLIEVRAAHWASHACCNDSFVALKAHEVLAGCQNWLRAQ